MCVCGALLDRAAVIFVPFLCVRDAGRHLVASRMSTLQWDWHTGQRFSDYNGMLQSFAERWLLTQNYTRQDITELRISCMLDNIVVVDATKLGVREFGILHTPSKGPLQKRHPTADGRCSVGAPAGEVSRRLVDTTAQVSRDPSLPGRLVGMGGTPRVAVADAATARGELH